MPFRSSLKLLMPSGPAASAQTPHDHDFDRLPSYRYKPLPDDEQDWIRILILKPSVSRDAPLACWVISRTIGSVLYEALSYTWGDQSEQLPLAVIEDPGRTVIENAGRNDWSASCLASASAMHITRNLHTALLHLRDKKNHRSLWMDAVCINQADQDEKQKQIRLMGSIYSNAFRTIIWVGEANENTGKLFFFLNLICRTSLAANNQRVASETPYARHAKLFDIDVAFHRKLDALGITRRMWLSLQELCDRPWFNRVWTAQEACLSQQALLLCGNFSIPWDRVANMHVPFLWRAIRSSHLEIRATPERLGFCVDFRTAKLASETFKKTLTLDFISGLANEQATDPKDKVFGTLAWAEELGVCFPPMEYTMSTAEIYATATRCWLQYSSRLRCLLFAVSPSITPDVPSWSIDWKHIPGVERIQLLAFVRDMAKDTLATQDSELQVVDGLGAPAGSYWQKLQLKGVILSEFVHKHVQSAGPRLARKYGYPPPPFSRSDQLEQLVTWENREYSTSWLQLSAGMQERPGSSSSNTCKDLTKLLNFLSGYATLEAKDTVVLHALLEQMAAALSGFVQDDQRDLRLELLSLSDAYRRENIGAKQFFSTFDKVAILSPYTLFSTTSGWVGGCYCEKMETGDVIALLAGSDFPMVLRQSATQGEYQLVGPAYIPKLMDGSVWSENVGNLEVITLV